MMEIIKSIPTGVMTALLLSFTFACNDDEPGTDPSLTLENLLTQGEVEKVSSTTSREVINEEELGYQDREEETDSGKIETRWICKKQKVSVTGGNSQFPLFDPNAEVIYPGSLLQGKTLSEATPSAIVVKRAGGTISYDLNTGSKSSFTVEEVRKSSIQDAMNEIIAGASDVVPANFQLDIINVQSEEQLAVEMGLTVKTWTTKASADMSFSTDKSYNRFLVKLKQSYYTMSFDLPTSLDELFHPSVTPEQLAPYVSDDNPATFVSSVTYGRIFYMLIESTSSEHEMDAKLRVSYKKFGNSAGGEVDVNTFKSLKNLKIKVIAYGGDAEGAFDLAGETSVENIANRLAKDTDIRTGKPLSYVVHSVKRPDQVVAVNLASEYNVVKCELKGTLPPEAYKNLVDIFASEEDGGGIGAASHIACSNVVLFNKAGNKYIWFVGTTGEVSEPFDIHDETAPLGKIPFAQVGAAGRIQDPKIYIFDESGLNFVVLNTNITTCNVDISGPLGDFDKQEEEIKVYNVSEYFAKSQGFPFSGEGIRAASRWFRNGTNDNDGKVEISHFFAKPGDRYSGCYLYNSKSFEWDGVRATSGWDPKASMPLEKVGAACRIDFQGDGGAGTNVKRQLFFDENGETFTIWNPTETVDSLRFSIPYVIN